MKLLYKSVFCTTASHKKMTASILIKTVKVACCLLLFFQGSLCAQIPEIRVIEQQFESFAENNEDAETEDDNYLQQLQTYLIHPLNLNAADETMLAELKILNPLQIANLLTYRKLVGTFISIYELQAVPGWDVETILKLRPYITVTVSIDVRTTLLQRLRNGNHSLLLRVGQVLEKSKGFLTDTSASSFYAGSPQKILLRYRYACKNLLQYGMLGEKDAGEQFFSGQQKQGFDFYSAHLFVRNVGVIKALAIGDFTVNLGQGLTQWQSMAFKKNADVMNIKRQSPILRPYHSAGEINFHRGVGVTLGKKQWQATAFVSYKKTDGNLVDSFANNDAYVSSLQTSGYHRTQNELVDKGVQRQLAYGGNITWRKNNLQIGLNTIRHQFKLPIQKRNDPYNLFALNGTTATNCSIHYSYTYKNAHFFGEMAIGNKYERAVVHGLMLSVGNNVDMSFLYRDIAPGYQTINANAFTESAFPSNERGLYMGISLRPVAAWRIDAYADFYRFPWLRFRVDAPSNGADFLLQATYKPNKELELYTRFRWETKAMNDSEAGLVLAPVVPKPRQNWRTQISYKLSRGLTFRSRTEMVWYNKGSATAEQGFLLYGDLLYKPLMKPFSTSIRLQYFETDGYNTRLYAYEQDVLYSFSVPVFYNKGFRWYGNLQYKVRSKWVFGFRLARTKYSNKVANGSGLDAIDGSKKTDVRFQILYSW